MAKRKRKGKYQLSARGEKAYRSLCAELKNISKANHKESRRRFAAGDAKGALKAMLAGAGAEADARRFGCSWASKSGANRRSPLAG
jgi:hypothetical protein